MTTRVPPSPLTDILDLVASLLALVALLAIAVYFLLMAFGKHPLLSATVLVMFLAPIFVLYRILHSLFL